MFRKRGKLDVAVTRPTSRIIILNGRSSLVNFTVYSLIIGYPIRGTKLAVYFA